MSDGNANQVDVVEKLSAIEAIKRGRIPVAVMGHNHFTTALTFDLGKARAIRELQRLTEIRDGKNQVLELQGPMPKAAVQWRSRTSKK